MAALIETHLSRTGKTQVALEAETGITDTHIARIRAGKLPGKWTMPPLAKALGMTTEMLAALVARERSAKEMAGRGAHGSRRQRSAAGGRKAGQP